MHSTVSYHRTTPIHTSLHQILQSAFGICSCMQSIDHNSTRTQAIPVCTLAASIHNIDINITAYSSTSLHLIIYAYRCIRIRFSNISRKAERFDFQIPCCTVHYCTTLHTILQNLHNIHCQHTIHPSHL